MRISGLQAGEPLSAETLLLESAGGERAAQQVISESRENYAIEYEEVKTKTVELQVPEGEPELDINEEPIPS